MIAKMVCRLLGHRLQKQEGELNYDNRNTHAELLDHRTETANQRELTPQADTKGSALSPELFRQDGRLLACRELSCGRSNLSLRQSVAEGTAEVAPREAPGGRALGNVPGQNFIYVHLNRVIKKYDLNMFYIAGPGHGGPALVATSTWKAPRVRFIPTQPRRRGIEKTFQTILVPRRDF